MPEVTTGIRSVLSVPAVYELFQRAIGSPKARRAFLSYVGAEPGMSVLDVGCGPGDLVTSFPDVRYVGCDINPAYIESANRRFGDRGTFFVGGVGDVDPATIGTFDRVIAKSVLHHIDDDLADRLCATARAVMAPGGRFVAWDACFTPDMSPIARFVISKDRGRNVRTVEAYRAIAERHFPSVETHVHHDLLRVPYSHVVMVCSA